MAAPSQGIDGKFLVLADKTALPPRCVRTNQPVAEHEYRAWDLPWIPRSIRILMFFVPFLLLAAPYGARHRCRMKAGVSADVRRHYLMRKVVAWLMIVGALVGPIGCVAVGAKVAAVIAMVAVPFLLWGGLVLYFFFASPLTIAKYEGDRFWIRGCSPAFLESLKASLGETAPAPAS